MRGAQSGEVELGPVAVIIPADAGSTRTGPTGPVGKPDHPRGCGEHSSFKKSHFNKPGSSPRMRGARRQAPIPVQRVGIIPADAGSTPTPGTCPVEE